MHIWHKYIRIDLKEVDVNTKLLIGSDQDRDYWSALVNEPSGSVSHGIAYLAPLRRSTLQDDV